MKFIPIDNGQTHNNLINLATNLFKLKYFYEEDTLERISLIEDIEKKNNLLDLNLSLGEDISIYVKAVSAYLFDKKDTSINEEDIQIVLDFFTIQKSILLNEEILDQDKFKQWIENREYTLD